MEVTASKSPSELAALVSPVIDYEPPPVSSAPTASPCPPPSSAALRRHTTRPLRVVHAAPREPAPPRAAVVFADSALRRILEVIDRRRPVAQLRPLVTPALIDTVLGLTGLPHTAAARLHRVRVRMVDDPDAEAAEVFATYTRGPRVRALAARIALTGSSWRVVALQIG
jgi:Family of unknown function (DUF6459)